LGDSGDDTTPAPIGVFDSGIGGLTVLSALHAVLPEQDFLYLGDNLNAPYGTRGQEEIFELTIAGVSRLFERGCNLVILACNTASAVALRRLQEEWLPVAAPGRRVLGIFVPVIETLSGRPWAATGRPVELPRQTVALFATPATVASGAFPRELGFRARGIRVEQMPCPGLVEALEGGDRAVAEGLIEGFCRDLLSACPAPSAAILGCTHYPLMAESFRQCLPEGTRFLSQPEIVAQSLADYLRRHPDFEGGHGHIHLLTTSTPEQVSTAAERLTGTRVVFSRL